MSEGRLAKLEKLAREALERAGSIHAANPGYFRPMGERRAEVLFMIVSQDVPDLAKAVLDLVRTIEHQQGYLDAKDQIIKGGDRANAKLDDALFEANYQLGKCREEIERLKSELRDERNSQASKARGNN